MLTVMVIREGYGWEVGEVRTISDDEAFYLLEDGYVEIVGESEVPFVVDLGEELPEEEV